MSIFKLFLKVKRCSSLLLPKIGETSVLFGRIFWHKDWNKQKRVFDKLLVNQSISSSKMMIMWDLTLGSVCSYQSSHTSHTTVSWKMTSALCVVGTLGPGAVLSATPLWLGQDCMVGTVTTHPFPWAPGESFWEIHLGAGHCLAGELNVEASKYWSRGLKIINHTHYIDQWE